MKKPPFAIREALFHEVKKPPFAIREALFHESEEAVLFVRG